MSKYGFQTGQGMYTGTKFETLSITTAAATAFSSSVYPAIVMRALFTVETTPMRYRYDGTSPTTATGHQVGSGDAVSIIGLKNIQNFRIIASSASGNIFVTYEVDSR